MGTFDFLSGTSGPNANQQAYAPMQQYSQFANTGMPQGMDYSQVLGGGQASPVTQGLDFGKIGQWALQQNQYQGQQQSQQDIQKMLLQSFGATKPTAPTGQMPYQPGRSAGGPLGEVTQGPAGYLASMAYPSLLGKLR